MKIDLLSFKGQNVLHGSIKLLNSLDIFLNTPSESPLSICDILGNQLTVTMQGVVPKVAETYFVGTINDKTLQGDVNESTTYNEEIEAVDDHYNGLFVFAMELRAGEKLTRTEIASLCRAFNHASKAAPTALIIKYGDYLSFSLCERTPYVRSSTLGEKAGKVSILRDINLIKPHRGHLDILRKMTAVDCKTFDALYSNWLKVFDNDLLTKAFYNDLQNWFFWAIKNVSFPNDINDDTDDEKFNTQNIIRLITRLIFVWFLKQKNLVPSNLFKVKYLKSILKDFDENDNSSQYYHAILQNLFFATLNKEIGERNFALDLGYTKNRGDHGIRNIYRYENLFVFNEPSKIIDLFQQVPYVNNSIFECLDEKVKDGKTYYWDGFSRDAHKQANIPNYLFFTESTVVDLSQEYKESRYSKVEVSGIIDILDRYSFTIEENTPVDVDVALDPELLGKVFENLLGAYNPETKETARKQTGSFYTPRKIVDFMVDNSIISYLKTAVPTVSENDLRSLLSYNFDIAPNSIDEQQSHEIIAAILNCKILDPACGSGAFPMGMLKQMSHILSKVDVDNKVWHDVVLDRAIKDAQDSNELDEEQKKEIEDNIKRVFNMSIDYPDYARKLYIIENCIYGVDIQSIAVQISRLRFFISLLCEQSPSDNRSSNYDILPLPNLEYKFVSANSLIGLNIPKDERSLFGDNRITKLFKKLKEVHHQLFSISDRKKKSNLEKMDKKTRDEIVKAVEEVYDISVNEKIIEFNSQIESLEKDISKIDTKNCKEEIVQSRDLFGNIISTKVINSAEKKRQDIEKRISRAQDEIKRLNNKPELKKLISLAKQITDWDAFDQNAMSPFFDPFMMFDITDSFDIIIANPPYISTKGVTSIEKLAFESEFGFSDDTYNLFTFKGIKLLKENGSLNYIIPKTFWTTQTKRNMRDLLLSKSIVYIFDTANPFENVMVDTCIIQVLNADSDAQHEIKFLDGSNDLYNPIEFAPIKQDVYKRTQNSVIFKPTDLNLKIWKKYGEKVKQLYDTWWDKIKTSRDIEKNKKELVDYRAKLKPGDVALLGCLTEGGQGLATANNGKYIAVRKTTKWAKNIIESRPKKLAEVIRSLNLKLDQMEGFSNTTDCLSSLTENQIAELFDKLKEKYGRDIFGQGYIYRLIDDSEIADVDKLTEDEKENGIDASKNFYVPYDKGDKDGNRWYLETPFAIAWSKDNVQFLKTDPKARFQGYSFYFREGFCWIDVNSTYLKARLKGNGVFDVLSMSLFSMTNLPDWYYVSAINSELISLYVDNFINNTSHFQINDARQLPIIIPDNDILFEIKEIVTQTIGCKQRPCSKKRDDELMFLQSRIDEIFKHLYRII